ncbi:MAG: 2-hydroxyglutaryl-CoA dehydratase [Syntrophaceae bacterium]|jgi:predicted CoA-substrate-specific enzyme activase|nr:2-hydroxyglutaryl-CoA dehydratase [Syntrophaceae bacterium]
MSDPKYYAGLDMGSVSIKAVIVDERGLVASGLIPSGGNYKTVAQKVMDNALTQAGLSFDRLSGLVITGLGAAGAPFAGRQVSDISCQARGCSLLFPSARTIIDIGGQFTKVAKITPEGRIADFLMSEKCATGSGRFLQVIARILSVPLDEIGPLSLQSEKPVEFSTNCAVFAESETISRIAEGARPADILAGVHRAMAAKVAMLVKRLKLTPDVVLTGGGGEDSGLALAVGEALKTEILVPDHPRLSAAYGAACLARENHS